MVRPFPMTSNCFIVSGGEDATSTPNDVIVVTDEILREEGADEYFIVGDQQIITFRF